MANEDVVLPQNLKRYLGEDYISCMTCFHLNVQSAKNKAVDLDLFFDQFGFSFETIMLTETWYMNDSDVLRLPMYRSFCINRTAKRGGGVAILTKDSLCELVSDFSCMTQDYEILCLHSKQSVFAVVYRPPNGNIEAFFFNFSNLFWYSLTSKSIMLFAVVTLILICVRIPLLQEH